MRGGTGATLRPQTQLPKTSWGRGGVCNISQSDGHIPLIDWWRLVDGGWRLVAVGGWRLAVGGPWGLSLRAVLNKKKNTGLLKDNR